MDLVWGSFLLFSLVEAIHFGVCGLGIKVAGLGDIRDNDNEPRSNEDAKSKSTGGRYGRDLKQEGNGNDDTQGEIAKR